MNNTMTFVAKSPIDANFISVIKSLRSLGGLGLKEAKDIADSIKYEGRASANMAIINNNEIVVLRGLGVVCSTANNEDLSDLRAFVGGLVLKGTSDALAHDLMEVLRKHHGD